MKYSNIITNLFKTFGAVWDRTFDIAPTTLGGPALPCSALIFEAAALVIPKIPVDPITTTQLSQLPFPHPGPKIT